MAKICKKCGVEIPENYKWKLCEGCRKEQTEKIMKGLVITGTLLFKGLMIYQKTMKEIGGHESRDDSYNEGIELFPDIDWNCDVCDAYLNDQPGFYDGCGDWTCTVCGNINPIDESEIVWEDDGITNETYDEEKHRYDDMPFVCQTCGNEGYPYCQESCRIFDD